MKSFLIRELVKNAELRISPIFFVFSSFFAIILNSHSLSFANGALVGQPLILKSVLRSQRGLIGQLSFSDLEYGAKRKKATREIFLTEMESVVPWDSMIKLIEPVYPKSAVGRPA